AEAGNTNNGAIDWTYQITDGSLGFLAAGEKVTLVSTVLVEDHQGGTDSATVTITITGTDDKPVIATTDKSESGPVTELANTTGSSALNPTPAAGGTIHFTDIDLTDRPDATITTRTVTAVRGDGTTPTPTTAGADAIKQAFKIAPEGGNTNKGANDRTY